MEKYKMDEALLKASDLQHINEIIELFARSQYELFSKLLKDTHLIKRKLGIIE